jgi:hypothetical protein
MLLTYKIHLMECLHETFALSLHDSVGNDCQAPNEAPHPPSSFRSSCQHSFQVTTKYTRCIYIYIYIYIFLPGPLISRVTVGFMVLSHVLAFLGNNRETSNYTTAIAKESFAKLCLLLGSGWVVTQRRKNGWKPCFLRCSTRDVISRIR